MIAAVSIAGRSMPRSFCNYAKKLGCFWHQVVELVRKKNHVGRKNTSYPNYVQGDIGSKSLESPGGGAGRVVVENRRRRVQASRSTADNPSDSHELCFWLSPMLAVFSLGLRAHTSPEGKREASLGLVAFWQHAPGHQIYNEMGMEPFHAPLSWSLSMKAAFMQVWKIFAGQSLVLKRIQGNLQPLADCSADQPAAGPRQPTANPKA
eukprot:1145613-Pelagomonas_calceolata.AAC.2